MRTNKFAVVGMIFSCLVIVCGVLLITGVIGEGYRSSAASPSPRDYGYATFGGDAYTYIVNNTGMAAYNAAIATKNLQTLGMTSGIALISMGLLSFCYFGLKTKDKIQTITISPEIETSKLDKAESGENAFAQTQENAQTKEIIEKMERLSPEAYRAVQDLLTSLTKEQKS